MKAIIAGTRDYTNKAYIYCKLDELLPHIGVTEIVSGMARGPDKIAAQYARDHKISLKPMPADWTRGLRAGPERNIMMAQYADTLIAFWDGQSNGTRHMINEMKKRGKPTHIILID